jgi:hypothetical protein
MFISHFHLYPVFQCVFLVLQYVASKKCFTFELDNRCFSTPTCPDRVWDPSNLLFRHYRCSFPGGKEGANQSPHLVQVIRMCKGKPPLFLVLWRSAQNWLSCSLDSHRLTFSEISSLISSMFDTYWVRNVLLGIVKLSLKYDVIHIPCNRHII